MFYYQYAIYILLVETSLQFENPYFDCFYQIYNKKQAVTNICYSNVIEEKRQIGNIMIYIFLYYFYIYLMIYLLSFNESYLRNLTGAILLSTLLGLSSAKAQDKLTKEKAEMCVMDVNKATNVIIELNVTGYDEYKIIKDYTSASKNKKFLFSSCTDIKFDMALSLAKADANAKLKLLNKSKGIQHILRYNEVNTWTVVIITEIMDPKDQILYVGEH